MWDIVICVMQFSMLLLLQGETNYTAVGRIIRKGKMENRHKQIATVRARPLNIKEGKGGRRKWESTF